MSAEMHSERMAAVRLLRALEAADDATCAEIEPLLPAFIEAEQTGVEVEADPTFARLLAHLDHCEHCVERYVALSEELEDLTRAAEEPDEQPMPKTSSTSAESRPQAGVVLRVLRGLSRRFELLLAVPQLSPAVATLGPGNEVPLFTDTLNDVAGAPRLRVVVSARAPHPQVQVIVREADQRRWQVQLTAGAKLYTAQTDDRGVAIFPVVDVEGSGSLLVRCSELPTQRDDE